MWPDNTAACDGLLSARLSYANSAYNKGDYDLVFQTVDCSVTAELELFEKAKQAKQRRSERESRIKLLQRLVATVVIIAIVGLSGLLSYALNEQRKAIQSAKAEKDAKIEAEAGRSEAEKAKIAAEKAQKNEENQRIIAEEREKEAELRRKEAVVAQAAELEAKQDAQRKTIQIQLDEYKSSIALASSRLASFDVRSAGEILSGLLQKVTNISEVAPPAFDTWGWRRIRLLGNTDLPQTTIAGRVISSATAAQANLMALATDTGNIQVYKVESGVLAPVHSHQEPNATAISLAMSADGTKLAYAYTTRESSGIGFWIPDKGKPELVRSAVGKNFQNILISQDGKSLLAGISAGLWIWNIDRDGWLLEESPATRLNNVRGASLAVQEITDKEYLLTVDFNKERELRLVNVVDGTNNPIEVPDSIRGSLNCALPMGNGQIALGLRDNRVAIANLKDRRLNVESILELKHSSAISKLALNPNGRFISMSDAEPVAQVWRKINDRWQYESYLTGLRDNLVDIATLSNGSLLGIDVSNSGTEVNRESRAIVWDIDRQTQRIRMERPIENEKGLRYPESVQHLVVGGFDGQVLSVDTNGCINAWNLLDGKVSDPTFSYLGHTPGAELVDSASSLESNVLVTVAKLRDSQRDYLAERRATWEFCLWDLESKQMVRRWTRTDEPLPGQSEPTSVEPRLSLVDQGRKLVLGSDSHTTIIDVETGSEFLNRSDWGTYFAVENPSNKSELLLVKRTGAIRLLKFAEPRWDDGKIDDVSLKLASEAAPMHAVWSRNGSHVYLAYANGDVAKVAIVDQTAKILWHSQMLNNDPTVSSKSIRLKSGEVRVHTDMDLLLKQDGDSEELQYAIRTGSTDRRTHHVGIRFPLKSNNAILIDEGIESIPGNRWLKFDDASNIILTEELHESFAIDSRRVRVIQQFGKAIFISSRSAQTYALKRGSDSIESFARTTPRAVTGDRSGRVLYSLNKEGSMTKFHLVDDSTSGLKNLNYQLPTADDISLSPNGKHLAVISDGHLSAHDPDLGTDQYQLGQADAIGWNPSLDAGLASCSISNGITVFDADFKIAKQIPFEFKAAETVVGLHFLTETFGIPDIMPRRHLLVHTRDLESDYVNIVALDPLPNVLAKTEGQSSTPEVTNLIRQPITRNSLIAVSPAEGIFATGTDNGTVNVWYCSPTWGAPRELFDLSGHRGSKITSIAFTTDGNTLITADDNKRLFAWITKDPQGKK
ncbi:MAG: hypothetical protein MUC43_11765 [Pirellula sp.]|nr:hypothetical protein [Pirellula sp.]